MAKENQLEGSSSEDSLSISLDWFVNPQTLADFHERFKDEDPDVIKKHTFSQGVAVGQKLVQQLSVEGDDEETIAALLKEVLQFEPTAKILSVGEGQVLLRNSGFCPVMAACMSLDLPWGWMCEVLGWPFFHGLASAVDPTVDLSMVKRRLKGDPYCDHIFHVAGEGKLIVK